MDNPAATANQHGSAADWGERVFSRLCPHGDWALFSRLWSEGRRLKALNYALVEFQLARGHELSVGRPYWLTVDPTNFCQLQCPFCPTGAGRGVRSKASMKLEHFRRLLGELGAYAVHLDLMNWGEPLLNKDAPEMIACAKSHGLEVKLDCNLNDLTEDAARRLVASGLDILSVSIDGASQATYEQYRIGGKLEQVLGHARLLSRLKRERGGKGPRLVWQFLVFKHNEHEVETARRLASETGFDDISFVAPFMPAEQRVLAAWQAAAPEYRLYPAASADVPAAEPRSVVKIEGTPSFLSYRARRFRESDVRGFRYLLRARSLSALARGWRSLAEGRGKPQPAPQPYAAAAKPICKWPWAGITVNPNGSVSPCCSVEDEADDFGNVFQRGWLRLWNGAHYRRSRRHVRRYARGQAGVLPQSDHVCERCTAIGYANFRFPRRREPVVSLSEARLNG